MVLISPKVNPNSDGLPLYVSVLVSEGNVMSSGRTFCVIKLLSGVSCFLSLSWVRKDLAVVEPSIVQQLLRRDLSSSYESSSLPSQPVSWTGPSVDIWVSLRINWWLQVHTGIVFMLAPLVWLFWLKPCYDVCRCRSRPSVGPNPEDAKC